MPNASLWVIADDRTGNANQAIGLANALNIPYDTIKMKYDKYASLPNIVRGASLLGVDKNIASNIQAPWPALVISSGRKTAPVARFIKKQSPRTKLIHLMRPDAGWEDFDLVAIPRHDNPRPRKNLLITTGAPHKVNQTILSQAKETWQDTFKDLPSPKIAVLVGGDTKKHKFTVKHAQKMAQTLIKAAKELGGSLLITTSRRTSDEASDALHNTIVDANVPLYFYDVNTPGDNPYFGFLACADIIIPSGDSISMCSESCATGKPVFIYDPKDLMPDKHQRFHLSLYQKNYARPFGDKIDVYESPTLDETKYLANEIHERFGF